MAEPEKFSLTFHPRPCGKSGPEHTVCGTLDNTY